MPSYLDLCLELEWLWIIRTIVRQKRDWEPGGVTLLSHIIEKLVFKSWKCVPESVSTLPTKTQGLKNSTKMPHVQVLLPSHPSHHLMAFLLAGDRCSLWLTSLDDISILIYHKCLTYRQSSWLLFLWEFSSSGSTIPVLSASEYRRDNQSFSVTCFL